MVKGACHLQRVSGQWEALARLACFLNASAGLERRGMDFNNPVAGRRDVQSDPYVNVIMEEDRQLF